MTSLTAGPNPAAGAPLHKHCHLFLYNGGRVSPPQKLAGWKLQEVKKVLKKNYVWQRAQDVLKNLLRFTRQRLPMNGPAQSSTLGSHETKEDSQENRTTTSTERAGERYHYVGMSRFTVKARRLWPHSRGAPEACDACHFRRSSLCGSFDKVTASTTWNTFMTANVSRYIQPPLKSSRTRWQ